MLQLWHTLETGIASVITLRPYQHKGMHDIRDAFSLGFKAPLYVAPTGSGKTRIFCAMAESAAKRAKRVLILVHRIELVDQVEEALKQRDMDSEIIAAGYGRRARHRAELHPVAVASVQTLVRRIDSYPEPTLIICDEAHHCAAGGMWSQIIRSYPGAKVLGVTATPRRLDGRGLGAHFDKLILGPTPQELTDQGYLAPVRIFAPPTVDTSGLHIRAGDFKHEEAEALMDKPAITGSAIEHYKKLGNGKQALTFCTSVAHAHHVAQQFRDSGIVALALDGNTDNTLRRQAMRDYRNGEIRVLTNCEIFGEGVDLPGVHVDILLRPTESLTLFLQQCGRAMRPDADKPYALILDHVGNTQRFGMPTDTREWDLSVTVSSEKRKNQIPSIKVCLKCFAASSSKATKCVECGEPFPIKSRSDIEEKEGQLVEVKKLTPEEIARKKARKMQGRANLEQLREFGKRKGYAPGWAEHVWEARKAKKSGASV